MFTIEAKIQLLINKMDTHVLFLFTQPESLPHLTHYILLYKMLEHLPMMQHVNLRLNFLDEYHTNNRLQQKQQQHRQRKRNVKKKKKKLPSYEKRTLPFKPSWKNLHQKLQKIRKNVVYVKWKKNYEKNKKEIKKNRALG